MNKNDIEILANRVETEFLPFVRRPSRYIGGEINQVQKDLSACDLSIALCFPDTYEVGMSNSGLAIIYHILNQMENVAAERVYCPWLDGEEILRKKNIPLFTLESKAPLKNFDLLGFSLSNELCYTNVLNVLDLAGLDIHSSKRKDSDPIIIAGGGMANCCEPMADFIDLFLIGEAEEAIVQLAAFLIEQKKAGSSKKEFLLEAQRKFDFLYVPALYQMEYDCDSRIKSLKPLDESLPVSFKNAIVQDFQNAPVPLAPIVPFAKAIHERVSIEIMRGCPGRCLFCQASYCRRPIRFRSIEKILEIAKASYAATGFDTISLLSLSTADYPQLETLASVLHEQFSQKHVGLSLPSLRVDQQLKLLPKLVTSVRKSGLTIAVEAANEKVRDIVNKPLKDSDLFAAVEAAFQAGWQSVKLYFMVGLPNETEDDIRRIVSLSLELAKVRRKVDGKTGNINAAVSWFVPKPHTPLSWMGQKPKSYFENAKKIMLDEKRKIAAKAVNLKFHKIEQSILEAAIGRGDRNLCKVIEAVFAAGGRFDLWDETFNYQIWMDAFAKFAMDLETAAQRQFDIEENLPWQHLGGPEKKYLLKHLAEAKEKMKNPD